MAQNSNPTQKDAKAFCDICQWVYECWAFHVNLFHNLPTYLEKLSPEALEEFYNVPHGLCLNHLCEATLKHLILEIAKLHDPKTQGKNKNLSMEFFEKQNSWTDEEKIEITKIIEDTNNISKRIKSARDNIIAHNDRETILEELNLVVFFEGEDEIYFRSIGKFCTLIWSKWGPKCNHVDRIRSFDFTKSGIPGDLLCPANAAKEFCKLIMDAYSREFDENARP